MTTDTQILDVAAMLSIIRWKDRAACNGKQELFFSDHKQTVVQQAKLVCGGCPVRAQCLAYALENTEIGIWGGYTANERRMMLRASRKEAHLKK
jgi:WhiB family redox-sensing transcriptional regulator